MSSYIRIYPSDDSYPAKHQNHVFVNILDKVGLLYGTVLFAFALTHFTDTYRLTFVSWHILILLLLLLLTVEMGFNKALCRYEVPLAGNYLRRTYVSTIIVAIAASQMTWLMFYTTEDYQKYIEKIDLMKQDEWEFAVRAFVAFFSSIVAYWAVSLSFLLWYVLGFYQ